MSMSTESAGQEIERCMNELFGSSVRGTLARGRPRRSGTVDLAEFFRMIIAADWDKLPDSLRARVKQHFNVDEIERPIKISLL